MIDTLFPTPKQLVIIKRVTKRVDPVQTTGHRTWRKGQGNVLKNRPYYLKNREKMIEKARQWNLLNKERHKEIQREYDLRRRSSALGLRKVVFFED